MENREKERNDSPAVSREYPERLCIRTRLIGAVKEPDTGVKIWGRALKTPVMSAPICGLSNPDGSDGIVSMAEVLDGAGAMTFVGMMNDTEYAAIASKSRNTVRIIKPYRDEDRIFGEIESAQNAGAAAVGMDLEHAFNDVGTDIMEPKTRDQLKRYIGAAKVPFVVKGILSAEDAEDALMAGAGGIYVTSHHELFTQALSPWAALPEIRREVPEDIPVFADGNVSDGYDVFKALALGADAVNIGFQMMYAINSEGRNGVLKLMQQVSSELKRAMQFAGCHTISDIRRETIRRQGS